MDCLREHWVPEQLCVDLTCILLSDILMPGALLFLLVSAGRAQTVDFVRTPYRYTLTLSEPVLVGKRRVAQVAAAAALKELSAAAADEGAEEPAPEAIVASVRKALEIFK